MTIRYVGPGGLDTNNGTSWATRKLTLSGVEATPVAPGDIVYVAPGVYRETLTVGVSGSAGLPITYIGDVTGANTDGIGGPVRITGSNDDQTAVRSFCITATNRTYRTFRGFWFNFTTSQQVSLTNPSNFVFEDCYSSDGANAQITMNFNGNGTNNIVRRCFFIQPNNNVSIQFTHTANVDNAANVVENCVFLGIGSGSGAVSITRVGGITVRNCTFLANFTAVRVITALTVGQTVTVNNCIITNCSTGVQATTVGELVEDYNAIAGCATPRTNVNVGANSNAYPPILQSPLLQAGLIYPWNPFALSQWSPIRRLAGSNMASDSLYGIPRPTLDAKKSWGAIQYNDTDRYTSLVHSGVACLRLADAGSFQKFVPTSATPTTFQVWVQWEANYAGTKPQMIIHQPNQADVIVTAQGNPGLWEQLSATLTPATLPGYCVVEFRSNNTATSGSYAAYFDDMRVG